MRKYSNFDRSRGRHDLSDIDDDYDPSNQDYDDEHESPRRRYESDGSSYGSQENDGDGS